MLVKSCLFLAMKNTYSDLVEQTFDWPSEKFKMTEDHSLEWNTLDLKPI